MCAGFVSVMLSRLLTLSAADMHTLGPVEISTLHSHLRSILEKVFGDDTLELSELWNTHMFKVQTVVWPDRVAVALRVPELFRVCVGFCAAASAYVYAHMCVRILTCLHVCMLCSLESHCQ